MFKSGVIALHQGILTEGERLGTVDLLIKVFIFKSKDNCIASGNTNRGEGLVQLTSSLMYSYLNSRVVALHQGKLTEGDG
jgi:hypothetical protein